jgi:hypothetical protein
MHAPHPIVIFVPVPVAGTGWITGPKKAWPQKPRPSQWPLRQSIPSAGARQALEQARRVLAQRRALGQPQN